MTGIADTARTASAPGSDAPIISMRGVWKFFGQLAALKDIHLDILPGE